jgi:aldehyde:ferredoxin oxidoreductase
MKDYSGKIMEIDLSHGSIRIKDIEAQLVRQYIGGIGFNARILYDEIPIGADPFGEENVLVFAGSVEAEQGGTAFLL